MHVILILVATAGHWIGILFKWKWKQWICKGACYDMLAAYWFLTASWVEKLLSSDVSKDSSRRLGRFVLIQVLKWETEQKQSLLISQTQPVTVSLLSSSSWNSPFDPTWPPITIFLTLTCRYFSHCSGDGEYLSHKKNHPSPLWLLHFVSMWNIAGTSSSAFAPLYHFPHVTVFSMHN